MKQVIRVMKALTDPSRLRIMKMLEQREMCVCEIGAALGLAQPTTSNHLKILEDAELVASRKEGLWVNYRLNDVPASTCARDMQRQLSAWLNDEPSVVEIVGQLPFINRLDLTRKVEAAA